MTGRMTNELRLPLCPLSEEHATQLRSLLAVYGLLRSL